MNLARFTPSPTTRRVGLLVAAGLFLGACGSASATSADTALAETAPPPTPIPTTAPIFLPEPDDSLPTLAPLEDQLAAPGNTAPAVFVPVADEVVEVAEPAQAAATATIHVVTSADRWSECVVHAAHSSGTSHLLDPVASATSIDLRSVELNTLAAASASCDMTGQGLALTDLAGHLPTSSACLNGWLGSGHGGSVFVGLASIGSGQGTPAWAQQDIVNALTTCFVGASFAGDVMNAVAQNPSLSGAFDSGCLATSFDGSGTLRGYAQSLTADPVSASMSISLGDAWVLSCANVGKVVAAAAAADEVVLSTATIACIDSELKAAGVVAQLIAGTADADAVGVATIACLTSAEAIALLH